MKEKKTKISNGMKKILFIEDESALQKTFGDLLKQEGFETISAFDGKTGLDLARLKKPDLILLDLILPKMDGFKVLEELKKDKKTKNIPVVVLTNLEGIEEVEKAIQLGATTYLVKAQYTLKEVISKVKEILKK